MIIVCTAEHECDPALAIAAARAGEVGLLNVAPATPDDEALSAVARLERRSGATGRWGVRWDAWAQRRELPEWLDRPSPRLRLPVLLLAGWEPSDPGRLARALAWARERASEVLCEVLEPEHAELAAAAGFDGLVLKGNEAGGRVSRRSSFLLLQHVSGRLDRPLWIQGAWGPDTAAVVRLAGATGIVLGEELWLAREASRTDDERARLARLDGTETSCLDDGEIAVRVLRQGPREALDRVEDELARGGVWRDALRDAWRGGAAECTPPAPMGQGIAFAGGLAARFGTVRRILDAFRRSVEGRVEDAARLDALAPGGPLARSHGVRHPIVQGPMTRVSDRAPFIRAVAANGALPFLALALMRRDEARTVLRETAESLGEHPWGVGILGFVPPELRTEQLEAIREVRPRFAVIAGGRPSQALELESEGIETYLHVPSPGLLEAFLEQGARKFVLEGRECGGHVGPRSSLTLWQSAIDVLRDARLDDPEGVRILFAGGIHDALSSAMVQTLAVPLVERGMRIGVLMGTSYLFTEEAVTTGAITRSYQEEAIRCRRTTLLESGVGHATRCAPTEFAAEFAARKRELRSAGLEPDEVRLRLELLNVGRLRIASKGLTRRAVTEREALDPGPGGELVSVDDATQRREGLYMIGSLAALREETTTMAALHGEVSSGGVELLRAHAAVRRAKRSGKAPRATAEPIAIVGMACLFPSAEDLRAYWRNILEGRDAVGDVPEDRWRSELFYDADRRAPDRLYSVRGAFLGEVRFDPLHYKIPPASLASIEPAQLLALEITRRALADAGYERRPFDRDRASVIVGCGSIHEMGINYVQRTMLPELLEQVPDLDGPERERIVGAVRERLAPWTGDSFPGVLPNVIAGRIANRLDLRGANFIVDAACSSSLAAVHAAVHELRAGTSDLVLAGAVDCTNNAFTFMGFSKTQALTPGERPRPFDASADGIVLGEGVATLALKRLSDAERDGDPIYAVLRGVGFSSDGRSTSLTAPAPAAQALALGRAYEDAGVDPATVSLIEAHATGTSVGDRAEISSLIEAVGADGRRKLDCAIGSVKSMIGHTKTTAGMAGLIKAVLALRHGVLPPTIHVDAPNPALAANDAFYLNTETRPWIGSPADHPRRAGVSAFGFGGTNFHVVLEEYTGGPGETHASEVAPRPAELFAWVREDRSAMGRDLASLREAIRSGAAPRLDRLARAVHEDERGRAAAGRGKVRCALVARSVEDLAALLDKAVAALEKGTSVEDRSGLYVSDAPPVDPGQVCFLFPGQGAQHPGMLQDLAQDGPFGTWMFEEADALLADMIPGRLSDRIVPRPAFGRKERKAQEAALTDTRIAQPALGVVDLFALDVLRRFGLEPAFAAGHSYGEAVALAAAGVFTRAGLLRLSARRGLVLHEVAERHPGGMAAVAADEPATRAALEELASAALVANANGPRQTIIAGPHDVLDTAVKGLMKRGIAVRRVAVSAAFHTPAMDEACDSLRENLAATPTWAPRIPVYSNVTAEPYPTDVGEVHELLTRNMISCVRWVDEVRALHRDGARLFVEVGPGRILTGLVSRILEGEPHTVLALEQSGQPAWSSLGHLLARTHALGVPLDLEPWFEGRDLGTGSVAEVLAAARAEAAGRPTDWWVGPARARPVRDGQAGRPAAAAARERPAPPAAEKTTVKEPKEDGLMKHDPRPSLVAVHRETMAQWLELQREQVRLNERFLRLQERLVAAELGLPEPATEAAPEELRDRPVAAPVQGGTGLRVAPAPVLPRLEPTGAPAPVAGESAPPATEPTAAAPPEEVPATAPAAAAAEPEGDGPPPVETFYRDLLAEVSQRTGYPEEMLDPELPLESGLGIDSIKVMEIFSALKPYHHVLSGPDQDEEDVLARFVELKTLGAIREHYAQRRATVLRGGTAPAVQAPAADESDAESVAGSPTTDAPPDAPSSDGRVDRLVVRAVRSEPLGEVSIDAEALRFSKEHVLLLVGEVPEYGPGLRAALAGGGYPAFQVIPGKELRRLGERRYEVDLDDPASVAGLPDAIEKECGARVGGMVSFLGLGDGFREPDLAAIDAPLQLAIRLLNLSKIFEEDVLASVEAGGGLLVNLTSLDGHFGLSDSRPLPVAQAASLGFFKALSKEWRDVRVKNIDVDPDADPQALLTALVAEIACWDDRLEVGIDAQGRWSVDLVEEATAPPGPPGDGATVDPAAGARELEAWTRELELDPESVVLATGGARGITAEVLRVLARETRTRLVIVGRSALTSAEDERAEVRELQDPEELRQALIRVLGSNGGATPAQIESELRAVLRDRAIRANLADFAEAGSAVEYHALDVRDPDALAALVHDVYERFGRIDGVVHGAGVVEDRRLKDKTPESFAHVFQTKVRPAMVLAQALRPESLKFLAFFSSLSGRVGNAGQLDYSAANECLNKLAAHLDREWPCRVVAMNWGPWDGGLISEALRAAYTQRGIKLIPPSAGSRACIDELRLRDARAPEVVLACDARRIVDGGRLPDA